MSRMTDWSFMVRRPDGTERREHFYAPDRATAAKYARAWCGRMGYEVVEDEAKERAA